MLRSISSSSWVPGSCLGPHCPRGSASPFGFTAALATVLWLIVCPLAFAQEPFNLVHPAPPRGPVWLDGYQIRWPVRACGDLTKQTSLSVLVRVPTGSWLKPDASDIAVQTADGKLQPHVVVSSDPGGETIVQFQRNGNDAWYWVYAHNPQAPARPAPAKTDPIFHEGLTVEVREWAGDDLSSWARVRAGLDKSTNVIGNAIVGEVIQTCNPAHPNQFQRFATSYRGYLDIKKPGTYRFFVNADDASFLFVDGFKVFERPGNNGRVGTIKVKELDKLCGTVELKEGVHAFEVHQAIGDKSNADGVCALLWSPPGQPKFTYIFNNHLKHPLYGRVGAMERVGGQPAAMFAYGMDDTLDGNGVKLFLVRFEAQGDVKEPDKLVWDFGDGTTGTGRSVRHVYFKEADYTVSLQSAPGLAPYRRTVRPWPELGETSPLSLGIAVKSLGAMDWKKLGPTTQREMFAFLTQCAQPERWKLLDELAQHLLEQKDTSLDFRSDLYTARIEALAHLGKSVEGLKLAEKVLPEFAKTPILQVRLQLAVATIHQDQMKDFKAASKIYASIIAEHGRTEHPFLRRAGIRWGDLFAESGDMVRAAETYRLAATLGGEKFQTGALNEASSRGAMLRIAEQKLKSGDIQQTRQLLEQIELNFPGQRIDGFYCFLRAETDRHAGRYDSALRHYEMLLKLPQWAGYRDRALLGIARSHFRSGEMGKARQEFEVLKEAFPKLYEAEKLPELAKVLDARIERIKSARAQGDGKTAFFAGYHTGFEPDESESFGRPNFDIVAAPGMDGPHCAMMEVHPVDITTITYTRPGLKNLTPGGTYWVEIWYKDVFRPISSLGIPSPGFLHVYLAPEDTKAAEVVTSHYLNRSWHQWHKLGFRFKAPLAQDFTLKVYFYNQTGFVLYDALSVQPVSEAQADALTRFHEGPKLP